MSIITGVVDAKARTGKSIKVGELWYGAFAAAALEGIERGDEVTFESVLDRTGKYNNIKGIVKKTGGTPAAPAADGSFKVLKPSLDRERSIIRQNALTNAREIFAAIGGYEDLDYQKLSEEIIAIARIFEAYTSGDADLEASKEALSKMEVE
jgi:hypothetical protein